MLNETIQNIFVDVTAPSTHIPVMLKEVMEYLGLQSGDCVVDATLGLGGHALGILKMIGPNGRLIGLDRDKNSLELAKESLKDYAARCEFVHEDYRHIDKVLQNLGVAQVDKILLDLGISSYQLENPERGFSFHMDGPLDMRMDQDSYISAYDLVNSLSEKEISSILRNFGEERWHNRIAHFLVEKRSLQPIASTKDLSDMVMQAVPGRFRHQRIHPATRTFQAIRIAVNRELEALDIALDKSMECLKEGGRIAVIAFHSLEDRIVKQKLKQAVHRGRLRLLTKKPLTPSEDEIKVNPRSRSAKLRVAEKIR